jgi:hypothetical protein
VDDDNLLMDMLWVWLPRYEGPSLILYRGENIDRFENGKIGSAWTDQEEIAEKFSSALNAEGKGGVILRTNAPRKRSSRVRQPTTPRGFRRTDLL